VRAGTRSLLASALAVLLGTAVACDDTTSPGSREVVLGGAFSITGNWSTLGVTSRAAMEIAIEDVNEHLAGTGLSFRADIQDTKLEPQTALSVLQGFQNRGVDIVIGPQSSAEVAAMKSLIDASGIILVSQSSTAGSLALADNIYRFTPSDTLEGVAIAAYMKSDGLNAIVPMNRADAGNIGLRNAARLEFTRLGGSVSAGVEYPATAANYTASVAALATQVQAAINTHGASKVGVYLAAFDEVVDVFNAAAQVPVLGTVKWYGSDGVALTTALPGNASAADFSVKVGYPNPIFGLDESARDNWSPLAAQIKSRAGGVEPDAFALAVYDIVWVAARAYMASGEDPSTAELREKFVASADSHFGATGWTVLNAVGDRKYADFDFWALQKSGNSFTWTRVAQYDTKLGILKR
jgi:branched-chain amino acid transport system substrate-binding protein